MNSADKNRLFGKLWKNNGLSIVLFLFFAVTLLGQSLTGWYDNNNQRRSHGQSEIPLGEYLGGGDFLEVTMENWESEFLQMFIYVVFTVFLYQKGSAESKPPEEEEVAEDASELLEPIKDSEMPAPVRAGGWLLKIYENSLSITFLVLFLVTFFLHAVGGVEKLNEEQLVHGQPAITLIGYLGSSRFWFESLQNWQSEFLALFTMVVLSIWLRQRGSPESKPVHSPHSKTGSD